MRLFPLRVTGSTGTHVQQPLYKRQGTPNRLQVHHRAKLNITCTTVL